MYPTHFNSKNLLSPLRIIAAAVTNDSCYTYANLVYSTQSVAMAVAIYATQVLGLP
jgi:hypothetical protein